MLFTPSTTFGLVRWHGEGYGTTRWQLFIARTGEPGDVLTRLPGVFPGALALASFFGARRVRRALSALRALECDGVVLANVPPSYWRRFQERITRAEELAPPSAARIRAAEILHPSQP